MQATGMQVYWSADPNVVKAGKALPTKMETFRHKYLLVFINKARH